MRCPIQFYVDKITKRTGFIPTDVLLVKLLLLLLFPLAVYKALLILRGGTTDFPGNIMLLIVIFGAGLQFIVLTWRVMEKNPAKRNVFILTTTIVCCLSLVLPFLGPLLPLPVRIILIAIFRP